MREDRTAHVAAERDDEKIADPQGRSVVARRGRSEFFPSGCVNDELRCQKMEG
jgi:hypothetical protein